MVNRPKAIGTAAESAITRYAIANGFPFAQRLTLSGAADRGDIALVPGPAAIIEAKADKIATTGQPGAALLATWLAETERERAKARADVALLIVKRKGTTDVGRWWAYWRLGAFLALVGHADAPPDPDAPVCMTAASALRLLRHHGYGTPLDDLAEGVGA